MTPQRIRWIALAAGLLVILAALFAWQKTVVVLADGSMHTVSTRALTVGGAVADAGLELGPQDELTPGALSILRSGLIIDLKRATQVLLRADGEEHQALTTERTPAALLAEFEVELGPDDRLLLAGQPVAPQAELPYSPTILLEVRRAVAVTLNADGQSRQFRSSAATLGAALAEAGIELLASDVLQPAATTPLEADISATLTRSQPVTIRIGEEAFELRTTAATVGEALAQAGIALQGLDSVVPSEDAALPPDGIIQVNRIYESVALTQQPIEFQTEWAPDPNIEIDNYSVIQLGQYGVQAQRTRVRYENGAEVSRQDEGSWTLVKPVTQIRGYGTNIVIRTAVVDGVEIEYWRTGTFYITSYSPCRSAADRCYYGTSLGDVVQKGIAATYYDWWLSMGNHTIFVPGYGPAKISDVGSYPTGEPWFDLAYSDEDWIPWGGYHTVYFTTPVPPAHEIFYLWP